MAMQPNQPQSIGGVLDITFQLYKASLRSVVPLSVLAALVDVPLSLYALRYTAIAGDTTDVGAALGLVTGMLTDAVYWGLFLVGMLIRVWIFAAMTLQVSAFANDQHLTARDALSAAGRRVASLLLATVLYALVVGVSSILLIPAIIFSLSMILALPLILFEAKGPWAALVDSHRLVWGCWWRTSAVTTVGLIIIIVVYGALGALVGVIPVLMGNDISTFAQGIASLILGVVLGILIIPIYIAMLLAIYWDLKLRKHGGDLAARVGALSVGA